MKSYIYKCSFKYLALTLFLAMSSSLFAISFNEPRKVIIPRYSNAVYRNLTVLDEMELEGRAGRTFLLELGKRPTYFWDTDHMFYTYLKSTLNLNTIGYTGGSVEDNDFTIENMRINGPDGGSFYSEKMLIVPGGQVVLSNFLSNLFVNYNDWLKVNLAFVAPSSEYNIYSVTYGHIQGSGLFNNAQKVTDMYVRDIYFNYANNTDLSSGYRNSFKFPSPRAIIYTPDNANYYTKGLATDFEVVSVNSKAKHYFGPWEILNSGKLSSGDPCASVVNQEKKCHYITVSGCASGTCHNHITDYDDTSSLFLCSKEEYKEQDGGPYNPSPEAPYFEPSDICYDYQVVTLQNSMDFNNNGAAYEFKVEEIHRINADNTSKLISQTPKTRTVPNANGNDDGLMKYNGSNWVIANYTGPQNATVNGETLPLGGNPKLIVPTSDASYNPCFYLCNGKLCPDNLLYIRDFTVRTLKGGVDSGSLPNDWPLDDLKQDLRIVNYTIGFCPKRIGNNNYAAFENNFAAVGNDSNVVEGLLIKSGSNWVQSPKVCVRRAVKCDSLSNTNYDRSYQLISTNY